MMGGRWTLGDSRKGRRFVVLAVAAGAWLGGIAAVTLASGGTFTPTGSLMVSRDSFAGTTLLSGQVLVAGGVGSDGSVLDSVELYDPATGTWSSTGSMGVGRREQHTATLLPDGRVLVAGGQGLGALALASAELYDPAAGTWSPTGGLATCRSFHSATLLPDGKVLVVGGYDPCGSGGSIIVASAELYDPSTGTWTATGSMAEARYYHTATLLSSGHVLVTGGRDSDSGPSKASAEIYDPSTGTWTATGNMAIGRTRHRATLLADGKLLITGGINYTGSPLLATKPVSTEIYDPSTSAFTTAGTMATGRVFHTATLLPNGQVLVAGGTTGIGTVSPSAEIYDPATDAFTTTTNVITNRYWHIAALLVNGDVLIAGGTTGSARLQSAELYHSSPSAPTPIPTPVPGTTEWALVALASLLVLALLLRLKRCVQRSQSQTACYLQLRT